MTDDLREKIVAVLANADRDTCVAFIETCRARLGQIADDDLRDLLGSVCVGTSSVDS